MISLGVQVMIRCKGLKSLKHSPSSRRKQQSKPRATEQEAAAVVARGGDVLSAIMESCRSQVSSAAYPFTG